MDVASDTGTARLTAAAPWPWAFVTGGGLAVIAGLLHPRNDLGLPEPQQTAELIGAATWIPAHALILVAELSFGIGLLTLARSRTPLSIGARRAAWAAAAAAVLFLVEGVFHLAAFVDEDHLLTGHATPVLSTFIALSVIAYPLFTFAVASLAVVSGRTLTHPAVGIVGAIGAVAFGVAPALVVLAGLESLYVLEPIGASVMALWFITAGVTALVRRAARTTVPVSVRPGPYGGTR